MCCRVKLANFPTKSEFESAIDDIFMFNWVYFVIKTSINYD